MAEIHIHIHEDADLSHVLTILNRIESTMTDISGAAADLTVAVQGIADRLGVQIPALQQALADAQAANTTLTDSVANLTGLEAADQAALAQAAADAAAALQVATDAATSIEGNVATLNTLAVTPPPPPPANPVGA